LANFLLVAKQVAILFVLIGAGAICRRAKLVDEFSIRGIVNVLLLLVTPSIVIDCFQRPFDASMLRQLGLAFLIATAMHLVLMGLALLTARGDEKSLPVLRVATAFSNAGFMGLPLQQAILGSEGVFYGIVYVALFNICIWTWGVGQMKGEGVGGGGRWKAWVNPGTVGLAVGLPLFLASYTLPDFLGGPVHMLANLNTPLAMLVIGYYLAGADLRALLRVRAAYTATFMRLIATPLLLVGVLYLLKGHLNRTMMLAMVTAASAPVAAMVTMFAAKYRRDVDLSVGLVSGTTILSVLTMPAVIAIGMAVL